MVGERKNHRKRKAAELCIAMNLQRTKGGVPTCPLISTRERQTCRDLYLKSEVQLVALLYILLRSQLHEEGSAP